MLFFPKVKIRWGKVILVSIILLVIQMIIMNVEAFFDMKYYIMPQYFPVWSKLMMPNAGPPPAEFFIMSSLFSLLSALVLACVYECFKASLDKNFWSRVLGFTKLMALLTLVFAYLPMYLMINLPLGLIVSWFVSGVLVIFLGTIVFVKILK
ncbi:hypothetical protein HZA76_03375 [Candidatus Roizmanbacteria bacterium]|nr:hypothetical protein [Candidatus Roizmanbacteria bacterium]